MNINCLLSLLLKRRKAILAHLIYGIFISFAFAEVPKNVCDTISPAEDLQDIEVSIYSLSKRINGKPNKSDILLLAPRLKEILALNCSLQEKKNNRLYVISTLYLGYLYYSFYENYQISYYFLLEALENKSFLNEKEKMHLYAIMADVEKIQSNYVNAIYFFNQSLDMSIQLHNLKHQHKCLREIGVIYRDLKEYETAERYFNKAIDLLDKLPNKDVEQIYMDLHRGRLLRLTGKSKEAKNTLLRGVNHPYHNTKNNYFAEPYILHEYGLYLMDHGQLDSAEFYFQKTINKVNTEQGIFDKYMMIPAYKSLGEISLRRGDTIKGIDLLKKSYRIGKELGVGKATLSTVEKLIKLHPTPSDLKEELVEFSLNFYKKQADFKATSNRFAQQLEQLKIKDQQIFEQQRKQKITLYILIPLLVLVLITIFFVLAYRKISKHRRKVINRLNEKTRELVRINHTNQNLLTILGHDLKNPILSLSFFTKQLASKSIDEQTSENNLDKIIKEIDELQISLENVLSWAQNQINGITTQPDEYNLFRLVKYATHSLKEQFREKNILLSVEVDEELNIWVDKDQFIIILRNLLNNAIKFSYPQSNIFIYTQTSQTHFQLVIEDYGIGMSDEQIASLFTNSSPFSHAGTNGEKGTGLGLMICKELLHLNKIDFLIESKKNVGTKIIIQFNPEQMPNTTF